MHKLLQYIATVPKEHRTNVSLAFLEKQLPEYSASERQKMADEIIKLCETYPQIFSNQSMPEVPIIGEVEGRIISAKVDRLVIQKDKVTIVDYKTNRPAAKNISEVPEVYLKQLHTYKELLQKIYPDKLVETYILWTNTCNMMKV